MGASYVKTVLWDWSGIWPGVRDYLEREAGGPITGRVSLEWNSDTGRGSAVVIMARKEGGSVSTSLREAAGTSVPGGGPGGREGPDGDGDRGPGRPAGSAGAAGGPGGGPGGGADAAGGRGAAGCPGGSPGGGAVRAAAGVRTDQVPAVPAGEAEGGEGKGPAEGEGGGGQSAEEPDLNQWHLPPGCQTTPVQLTACPLCGFPVSDRPGEVHGQVDGPVVRCTVNIGGHRPWRTITNVAG